MIVSYKKILPGFQFHCSLIWEHGGTLKNNAWISTGLIDVDIDFFNNPV
jgi:hypothetical protein